MKKKTRRTYPKKSFFYRFHAIRGHGKFRVMRYINRVDVIGPGLAGTHGWQVRYHDKKSRFFSDVHYESPEGSLKMAEQYLRKIYRGIPCQQRKSPTNRKNQALPIGINETWRSKKDRNVKEGYFQTSLPTAVIGKFITSKKYIGTENTVTDERRKVALTFLMQLREKAYKKHRLALSRIQLPPED